MNASASGQLVEAVFSESPHAELYTPLVTLINRNVCTAAGVSTYLKMGDWENSGAEAVVRLLDVFSSLFIDPNLCPLMMKLMLSAALLLLLGYSTFHRAQAAPNPPQLFRALLGEHAVVVGTFDFTVDYTVDLDDLQDSVNTSSTVPLTSTYYMYGSTSVTQTTTESPAPSGSGESCLHWTAWLPMFIFVLFVGIWLALLLGYRCVHPSGDSREIIV